MIYTEEQRQAKEKIIKDFIISKKGSSIYQILKTIIHHGKMYKKYLIYAINLIQQMTFKC